MDRPFNFPADPSPHWRLVYRGLLVLAKYGDLDGSVARCAFGIGGEECDDIYPPFILIAEKFVGFSTDDFNLHRTLCICNDSLDLNLPEILFRRQVLGDRIGVGAIRCAVKSAFRLSGGIVRQLGMVPEPQFLQDRVFRESAFWKSQLHKADPLGGSPQTKDDRHGILFGRIVLRAFEVGFKILQVGQNGVLETLVLAGELNGISQRKIAITATLPSELKPPDGAGMMGDGRRDSATGRLTCSG